MDVYNEIHISNMERNTNENVLLDWEFEPGTPASLVRFSATDLSRSINIHGPSGQTTTFLMFTIHKAFSVHSSCIHPLFKKYSPFNQCSVFIVICSLKRSSFILLAIMQ